MSIKWSTVFGFPHLIVSSDGQIKAIAKLCQRKDGGCGTTQQRSERVIIPADKQGYLWINIAIPGGGRKFLSVHRLMVETFIRPLVDEEEINHVNGKRSDNRLENLEIVKNKAEHNKLTWERLKQELYNKGYAQDYADARNKL